MCGPRLSFSMLVMQSTLTIELVRARQAEARLAHVRHELARRPRRRLWPALTMRTLRRRRLAPA